MSPEQRKQYERIMRRITHAVLIAMETGDEIRLELVGPTEIAARMLSTSSDAEQRIEANHSGRPAVRVVVRDGILTVSAWRRPARAVAGGQS